PSVCETPLAMPTPAAVKASGMQPVATRHPAMTTAIAPKDRPRLAILNYDVGMAGFTRPFVGMHRFRDLTNESIATPTHVVAYREVVQQLGIEVAALVLR